MKKQPKVAKPSQRHLALSAAAFVVAAVALVVVYLNQPPATTSYAHEVSYTTSPEVTAAITGFYNSYNEAPELTKAISDKRLTTRFQNELKRYQEHPTLQMDPILCAQNQSHEQFKVERIRLDDQAASAIVTQSFGPEKGNYSQMTVNLAKEGDTWLVDDVTCTPPQVR